MSVLDKLRKEKARLEKQAENRGGQFEKIDWFQPQTGDNLLRFLPHAEKPEDELPYVHVKLHFIGITRNDGGTTNISVRCLNDLDEGSCPVCKAYDKWVKKDKEKARAYRAQEKYIYNVLNYKERKVQPYAAGPTVHEALIGYAEDFGDIFSLSEGRDWKLVKKLDPRKPKPLNVTYVVRPTPKETALAEKFMPLLEGATDLTKLYSTNEKKKMLEWLGEPAEDDETDSFVDTDEAEEKEDPREKKLAAAKAAKAAAAKKPAPKVEEDEPSFDDEDEDEKPAPKAAAKKSSKPAPKDDDEDEELEDDDMDISDDDLENELKELGV